MKKVSIVLASLLVAACASSPKAGSSLTSQNDSSKQDAAAAAAAAAKVDLAKLNDEIQKLEKQSDYFDYNKAAIKPEYQAILKMEAEFLKSHQRDRVTLQGNADERGSEKYNLDLGARRAQAVEQSLIAFGVPAAQIQTVSFGKDKPRLTCHEEKCWKENRRVDFDHQLD